MIKNTLNIIKNLFQVAKTYQKNINDINAKLADIQAWQRNFFKDIPTEFPIAMLDTEQELLCKYLNNAQYYLEFGSGGSTFLACNSSIKEIHTIDSDILWLDYLRSYKIIIHNEHSHRLNLHYIDLGKISSWGYPANQNRKDFYEFYSNISCISENLNLIDTVLVDGRFRVACILQVIIQCIPNVTILVHDYSIREYYHIIEEFLNIVEYQNTLYVFQKKKNFDLEKCKNLYEIYKFDLR